MLELLLRETLRLGHSYIGAEHILLSIVREGQGLAAQILSAQGADCPVVQRAVHEEIERGGDSPAAAS